MVKQTPILKEKRKGKIQRIERALNLRRGGLVDAGKEDHYIRGLNRHEKGGGGERRTPEGVGMRKCKAGGGGGRFILKKRNKVGDGTKENYVKK